MKTVPQRVAELRKVMAARHVDTYVILSSDAHGSEYVGSYWQARAYISGFTGSAGTVVVTRDRAACWVDGRYFLQGETQLKGTGIECMKMGEPGVPSYEDFCLTETPAGGTVGIDGRTIGSSQAASFKKKLASKQITFSCQEDLIGLVWDNRPGLPNDPIFDFPVEYAGESRVQKVERLRRHMEKIGADYYLEASLEANAWLLNYRCWDVANTPVAYAYCIVGRSDCRLFIEKSKVPPSMQEAFEADGVTVLPYSSLSEVLSTLRGHIAFDPRLINELVMESIPAGLSVIAEPTDEVILMKAVKNPVEQENFRKAHVRDGAVMVRLLKWVKDHAADGITECDVCDYLDNERRHQEHSLGISFDTIAGYGPNGAIVHYEPSRENCAVIRPEGFLLVDSGAQYLEGTTDITRTIACGPLTDEEKRIYTLVLKGHLQLGHARFREGITGTNLDVLARKPLWDVGLDYKHGTGHGVGYVLSVHEGPQNISYGLNPIKLREGMIVSDEPGFYPTGKFGVRIENLVMVVPFTQNEWGRFLQMEPLTYCPYERDAIVREMLTPQEITWVNEYHQQVYKKVSPLLDEEHKAFLREATRAL